MIRRDYSRAARMEARVARARRRGDDGAVKTSLDHLPEGKRRELAFVVDVLRSGFAAARSPRRSDEESILKIVLFGSYARGDWVEDPIGNLTASGTDSYGYTSENLMKSGPGSTGLSYDPLLRLYQVASGTTTTRFAYDGLEMVAEYNGSNVLQHRYVFGPGSDEPIVQYDGTGTTSRNWLVADERGSIIAMTNGSGAVTHVDSYDEYGIPGTSNSGRFHYTGQAWLPEIGMYYYKARMYSPSLGRFMQTDPIGYNDGLNWYNYVHGDPVNFADPMGLAKYEKPIPPKRYNPPWETAPSIIVTGPKIINWYAGNTRALQNRVDQHNAAHGNEYGGSSGNTPQRQTQTKPKPTRGECALFVLREDGLALGLDAAGIAAEILLPEIPAVIAAAYVGVAAFGNSIAHNDRTGAVIAYGGRHAGMAEGFFKGSAKSFARGLSIIGLGASTIRDLVQAKHDYDHCMAGM